MGLLSSSVGLSAWRWAFASPHFGSRCFRSGQRKAIIRTHRLSETGSDYMGLVPVVGLEPTRCCHQRILSPSRLPIPSHRQKRAFQKESPMELMVGIEPTTCSLRVNCSAIEPHQHKFSLPIIAHAAAGVNSSAVRIQYTFRIIREK